MLILTTHTFFSLSVPKKGSCVGSRYAHLHHFDAVSSMFKAYDGIGRFSFDHLLVGKYSRYYKCLILPSPLWYWYPLISYSSIYIYVPVHLGHEESMAELEVADADLRDFVAYMVCSLQKYYPYIFFQPVIVLFLLITLSILSYPRISILVTIRL